MLNKWTHERMTRWSIWALVGLVTVALTWMATISTTMAQSPAPVKSLRLYVMDCGFMSQFDLRHAGIPADPLDHPDPCFLIVHPKGTLLWETGWNDTEFDRPGGGRGGKVIIKKSLKSQLAEIGYKPQDITYLAFSHYHADHAGNGNDYASSTWITQKDMWHAMFGPFPGVLKAPLPNVHEWDKLKNSKTIIVDNKDYDIFGDGSVTILYTPASTPGHQSLMVNLPKTGKILIGGDIYTDVPQRKAFMQFLGRKVQGPPFTQAEIDTFRNRTNNWDNYLVSVKKVEALLVKTGAQLWIQHDMVHFKTLKLSPAYYD